MSYQYRLYTGATFEGRIARVIAVRARASWRLTTALAARRGYVVPITSDAVQARVDAHAAYEMYAARRILRACARRLRAHADSLRHDPDAWRAFVCSLPPSYL